MLMKECKKQNLEYKKAAIGGLASMLEVFESEKFGLFFTDHLKGLLDENSTLLEGEEGTEEEKNQKASQLRLAALAALAKSWPSTNYAIQKRYFDEIVVILSQLHLQGVYKIKIEVILTLNKIVKR